MAIDNGEAINRQRTRALRIPVAVPAGALATLTMDLAMVAAARYGRGVFTSDRLGPDVIGRWAGGLLRGRWRHRDIGSEPAYPGELALGILTHYATGIVLTQAFLVLPRRGNGRPSFLGATGFGIATAALPLLVLYPSLGYGCFGLRSGEAARPNRIMLLGHTAFGIGIGLWSPYFVRSQSWRRPSLGPPWIAPGHAPWALSGHVGSSRIDLTQVRSA
ncbi:MAG: DUF2938 family protein [Candidatus Limnocylindrales bacterium]|jgi:hypothetical protein